VRLPLAVESGQMSGLRRATVASAVAAALAMLQGCFSIDEATHDGPKDGGAKDSGQLSDGGWVCTPKTCAEQGADCGDTSDGCGNPIHCGTCASGETCGAAGPNRCGVGTCTPSTCASAGASCGLIGDGCGATLSCGSCPAGQICGGGGQANQCGCTPTTCAAAGKQCGTIADGCGGQLSCGSCPSGQTCTTSNACCTPTTCAAQGKDCGTLSDGCGATLSCGSCPTGKTCVSNACVCVATTCAALSKNCGSVSDGCGGTLSCGSCTSPATCGSITPNVCGPIWANSFELTSDYPSGWTTFENCAADTSWNVTRVVYAAPSGGSYCLRMVTTGFKSSCQDPGVYAVSPPLPAQAGHVYRVESWSRNSSFVGTTSLHFLDAADNEIGSQFGNWSPDSWAWNADSAVQKTAPAGTAKVRVRLSLITAAATVDIDLLQLFVDP
jgi:hypothetical protein